MYPQLHVDLAKIRHNAQTLVQMAKPFGISIWGVPKVLCGAPEVGEAMLSAGITTLADSRWQNLERIVFAMPAVQTVLLRMPSPRQAQTVVHFADWSLNSEWGTLQALSHAAVAARKEHKVLLMVDVGDLREGLWPDQVIPLVRKAVTLPGLKIDGIGANMTCYGGVIPDANNLGILVQLADELRRIGLVDCEIISGGNSSSIGLLERGKIPKGINNLRLGESLILGCETITRRPLPGLFSDAITLQTEVIEIKEKPSLPIGTLGQDAFGNKPIFTDVGEQRRVILAIGRQDVNPAGLVPLEKGITILGASSDHLLLDASAYAEKIVVGQIFSFSVDYGALLAASTSAYVTKVFV